MRWMWIDRIVDLVPDERLVAIKNVTLAEDHLHDHFAAEGDLGPLPVFPAPFIIEGMAQTAGILVGSLRDFREKVLLAKIAVARFEREVFPGQTIRYDAELERIDAAGAATKGTLSVRSSDANEWEDLGVVDLMFSHADNALSATLDLPEHNFVFGENMTLLMESAGFAAVQH